MSKPNLASDSQAEFDRLQRKLVPLWKSIERFNQDPQTIVVVPSMSIDAINSGAVMQAYEERFLFLLLLLRQARARLIYVTSQTILPSIIDYYLGLLPGVIPSHARQRLFLISPLDLSVRPLSDKLLDRPRLIQRIRSLIMDPDRAHLVPFNTTNREKELALRLGIPMYGADPKFFPLGTKSGCRKIFIEENVAHPLGVENLGSKEELIEAIAQMRAKKPSIKQVLAKLNEGVSGEGNAVIDLSGLPAPGDSKEKAVLAERLRAMQFGLARVTYDSYMKKLQERRGVVEERIVGQEIRSPSVQLRVTPLGAVELLSTHDQLLGGPSGQSYLGCVFPADPGYAALITREAAKVGRRLAKEGVIGRFALDFVVVRLNGKWEPYAIEINLRKGGTTHPFLTLQFLTDGNYDPETAIFTAPNGQQKFFVASDHVESPSYRTLTPDDLFDIVVRHDLHFDQTRQTGVVFHMMSALGELGRTGLTAVGNSYEEAQGMYGRAVIVLDQEAGAATPAT
ncbi:MAG TPA: peptide ligase PGM1-related protein [Candidatus Udaeobacter sp.]|nr:peptide ligase PGM1-related protein [Candidatus Udaeobacter sp.]